MPTYIHIHTRTTTVVHKRLKQMYWIIHFQVTFQLTPPVPPPSPLSLAHKWLVSRLPHAAASSSDARRSDRCTCTLGSAAVAPAAQCFQVQSSEVDGAKASC